MEKEFEVSFNSPQCGWMSIGFEHDGGEFHTTTAHAPYTNALSELLMIVRNVITTKGVYTKFVSWNRDPEEYSFVFDSDGTNASIEILEHVLPGAKGEQVYCYRGDALQLAKAFAATFQQMYDERDIDEFEENWHQKFPVQEFEDLKKAIENHG